MVHGVARGAAELRRRAVEALTEAGLTPAEAYLHRLPFELSGGQRQRVVIAAALALRPGVLVADEPVSMLDVSIRAEILNLLGRLATEQGIAVVMITHDLSTVAAYADRIAVMYLGRIVEIGPTPDVLGNPRHPYTQALLSVVPVPDPAARRRPVILSGETPDPSNIPSGCRFHPRCPVAFDSLPDRGPATVRRRPRAPGRVPPRRGGSGDYMSTAATTSAMTIAESRAGTIRSRRERSRAIAAPTMAASAAPAMPATAAPTACASVGEALPT